MSTAFLPLVPDALDLYITQIKQFDLLSREEEYQLATAYRQQGDLKAAHRLICSNLRFVVKIAHEYRGYGLKILDLIQEGNIGLMMALKKFDPERGLKFITYAVWWIRAYINNFVMKNWSLVKIGTTQAQKKLFFKLKQTTRAISRLTGGEAAHAIANELAVRDDEVEEMALRMAGRDTSLDLDLTENDNHTLLDSLADDRDNQEQLLLEHEETRLLSHRVENAMGRLNDRERHIIRDRILCETPKTLQELADDYGVSRERIRQIEKQALNKVKEALLLAEST
ncbi:MAG: RNA polymerase sigma factor RpoH [Syntrophotaleaceae bacterium]